MRSNDSWLVSVGQRAAAVEAVAGIREEIEVMASVVAVATPAAQRLHFTRWIAQARAVQEAWRGRPWARDGAYAIAQVLGRLARIWWPGSAPALALGTRPTEALREFGVVGSTWAEVAARAEQALRGALGWADDAALEPRPHDAGTRFVAVVRGLEAFGGALGRAVDLRGASKAGREEMARIRRLAAEVRWLRGCVDGHAWGAAIGRLRGLARELGSPELDRLLDPRFVPAGGWAALLEEDPRRERILAERPGNEVGDEAAAAWFVEAIDAGVDVAEVVAEDEGLRARLARLPADLLGLGDRRHRRHLRRIVGEGGGDAAAEEMVGDEASDEAMCDDEATREAGEPAMVAALRRRLAGKRAIFVSNRASPEIAEGLERLLGLRCDAEALVGAPRRRQAAVERIRAGSYDLVLVAQGFAGHGDTQVLAEAAKDAGCLFWMVQKGRIGKIVASLGVALGVNAGS